jgi:hypothetical protein
MAQPKRTTTIRLVNDEIEKAMAEAVASSKTKKVDIFGEEFDIVTDANTWIVTRMLNGDPGAASELLQSILVRRADAPGLSGPALAEARNEDANDQQRLNRVLSRQRGLTDMVLVGMLGRILEIVADRPTKPPSASGRTSASTGA